MLVYFKAKNYMSFSDEVVLDMRATAYKQHPDHVVQFKDYGLLKTAAIYGANASGKSNFIKAMHFFKYFILLQILSQRTDLDEDSKNLMKFEPYLLTNRENPESEFEAIFRHNGLEYQYGFSILGQKIVSEWYYLDGKKIYERENADVKFGYGYASTLKRFRKVPEERLYISILDWFLQEEEKKKLVSGLIGYLVNQFITFDSPFIEPVIKGSTEYFKFNYLLENSDMQRAVLSYLKRADISIRGFQIVEKDNKKEIETQHAIYNESGEEVGLKYLKLAQESAGTKVFMLYAEQFARVLSEGGVFVVDEMCARLHPLLSRMIIDFFQSKANEKAQLVFTTHDTFLLAKEQFRRDEIWLVEKDDTGQSSMFSLSALRIREDANYRNDYIQGKYGAIPIISQPDDEE